jgi:hypothetical protein
MGRLEIKTYYCLLMAISLIDSNELFKVLGPDLFILNQDYLFNKNYKMGLRIIRDN